MRKIILNLFYIFAFFILFLLSTSNINAQTCTGSHTSTSLYQCVQDPLSRLWSCPQNGSANSSCSFGALGCTAIEFAAENCDMPADRSSCAAHNKVDANTTSGCFVSSPPTSTPVGPTSAPTAPPNGACGGCNTCGAPQNECALINGVCSKAGYCGGGIDPTNCGGYLWSPSGGGQPIHLIDNGVGGPANPSVQAQVVLTSGHTAASVEWSIQNAPPYCFGGQGACNGLTCSISAYPGTLANGNCDGTNSLRAYVIATNGGSCALAAPVRIGPRCNVSGPTSIDLQAGETRTVTVNIDASRAWVTRFISTNVGVATVSPRDVTTEPVESNITGVSTGTSTVNVDLIQYPYSCRHSITVNVTDSPAWWQAEEGDVITTSNITSTIPATCTLPSCNPLLNLDGLSGRPGNVIYGNALTGNIDSANVSSRGWLARTTYAGRTYNFAYFDNLKPNIPNNLGAVPGGDQGALASGGSISADGYYWYEKTTGTLNINSALNIGDRKVVVFAGDDINIRGNITYNNGSGFLMVITSGDVIVDPAVTELEGIYVMDGEFNTGTGNTKLTTRGSVVAWTGVNMDRNLGGAANETSPSHVFEYDPPTILLFPKALMQDTLSWKEIQP